MAHRKRARNNGARAKTWFLGACVMNAAAQGASAFAFSSYSASSFSLRGQADPASRGTVLAKQAVAPAGRAENLLSMKIKKAGKKPVRSRRSGPPANVEGYSHAAFVKMKNEVALQVATNKKGSRRTRTVNFNGGIDSCPCLVLNADYQPLSYLPLSLWGWQDVIKAVFSEKVVVLATYGDRSVRSPSVVVQLPSVIALKEFVNNHRTHPPFTRRNLFLRDSHQCQYCQKYFAPHNLSFDHVVPKKLGGKGTWDNVVTACGRCNNRKSDCHPRDLKSIGMSLAKYPVTPTFSQLQAKARRYPPLEIHETWGDYLYFESEILEEEDGGDVDETP
ncbi:unnamed protein product [Ectocarpus sp. 6 AP-2014]|uniref:HNH endonuclease family protein n=1 Tax=Ectocarpus siliculosus TaxID=2880 RepID=D8LRG1_ECTSI|nr:HNH endonuclease family protein [Ectocarpus siliculosus]|eukprot:CBN75062.1 HNH endonuclease family protein [Ectocarpus siliculosus]